MTDTSSRPRPPLALLLLGLALVITGVMLAAYAVLGGGSSPSPDQPPTSPPTSAAPSDPSPTSDPTTPPDSGSIPGPSSPLGDDGNGGLFGGTG